VGARLLLVLDQFEEFVILGKPEQQHEFADLLARLKSASVNGAKLLLVLRSDYQTFLDEIGLPPPRYGENLYQVARFTLATGAAFLEHSNLNLQPDARGRLLASAAELDETPGLVRPITLNVIGHVLASSPTAPSLDAGQLVRRYIEQTVGQPAIRGFVPVILEQLITEQGTKQPRSEEELAHATGLRHGEVRSALNGLGVAALARPLDPAQGVWELSHDFIARAVARYLGRRRHDFLRRVGVYTAPVLLAVTLLAIGGVVAFNRLSYYKLESQLANLGLTVTSKHGAEANSVFTPENFAKAAPLLAKLSDFTDLRSLNLSQSRVTSLEPLKDLTALRSLNLSHTRVTSLEPLKDLTALQSLDLSHTEVASWGSFIVFSTVSNTAAEESAARAKARGLGVFKDGVSYVIRWPDLTMLQLAPNSVVEINPNSAFDVPHPSMESLKDLSALQSLDLSDTRVTSVLPLKDLTALRSLNLSHTQVRSVESLKNVTALQSLDLSDTQVTSVEPLKDLTALQSLNLSHTQVSMESLKDLTALQSLDLSDTQVTSVEPLKDLTALQSLDLSDTQVTSVEPLKDLTALQLLDLTGTKVNTTALYLYREKKGLPPIRIRLPPFGLPAKIDLEKG
jgi:Leucine-rich repeat (LRR) protein